ncbi:MAG: hypothetical protein U5K74_00285 [Gemmatimonadaceae bacterium]|nr:hypothetical protein [Gemmatimonadaceae bacterium]
MESSRRYGTIVVCGGGCYGGYYVRQLARARRAAALHFDRVLVVDRDPDCRVARLVAAIERQDETAIAAHGWALRASDDSRATADAEEAYRGLPVRFIASDWLAFLTRWFAAAIAAPHAAVGDAVVPSPLMPNLLAEWVRSRLDLHRPLARSDRETLRVPPLTPWSRTGADGSHFASYATWMCPINCIEPPRCPETRGPRDWTMPAAVQAAASAAAEQGTPFQVIAMFQTSHRAYGVGMFDVDAAIAADRGIEAAATGESVRVLVASVSHCHGALAALSSVR